MCLSQRTHFSRAHHHTLSTVLSPAGNLGCFNKTQQLREQRSLFLSVCSIFACPDNSVFGILNMHADVNACSCTQGLEQLLGLCATQTASFSFYRWHGFDTYILISHCLTVVLSLEKGAYLEDSHTVHCPIKLAFLSIIYVIGFCAQHQTGGR